MKLSLAAIVVSIALIASGCGGVSAQDLFIVYRTGASPHAKLTLLVNEEGGVTCNGGKVLKIGDAQIVKARAIQEELEKPASEHLVLPAAPGSVLRYYVRDENGTVDFADNSHSQPKVLRQLVLFVLQTAQQVCHLPE
jgi:hypothetical protein